MINADGSGFRKITSGANNNGFAAYSPMASGSCTGLWGRMVMGSAS